VSALHVFFTAHTAERTRMMCLRASGAADVGKNKLIAIDLSLDVAERNLALGSASRLLGRCGLGERHPAVAVERAHPV
jgi:hypothetical protein